MAGSNARREEAKLIILVAGARGVCGSVDTRAKAKPTSDELLRSAANSSMSRLVAEATGEKSISVLVCRRDPVPDSGARAK